jgi:hypothetical protein
MNDETRSRINDAASAARGDLTWLSKLLHAMVDRGEIVDYEIRLAVDVVETSSVERITIRGMVVE